MHCFLGDKLTPQCFESILQSIAEGIFLIDTDGIIRYCNSMMEQMIGLPSNEIVGKECCSFMNDQCTPPPLCTLFEKSSLDSIECKLRHVSGSTIPVLKNARVLKDSDGIILGAVESFTDISSLKKTEEKLRSLEIAAGSTQFGRMVGKSRAIKEVFNLIELAGASNATILITGETGTGKELIAQGIHENSARKNAPLIKINCSAIPETLLESELFGHSRGSFTGAIKDKIGRFEMAEGGTIFLDEVGELSPLIQVKFLRILQEREFERVGEGITRKSDVRIIAATHRDLRRLVHEGKFREDLFYRLKVFPITIAPLRDRKEDIGPLIEHFIRKFNAETKKNITGLNHDAAVTMMDYCWPGNIRELENAIEHAFVTCQESLIGIFDLPLEIRRVELRKGICTNNTPFYSDTISLQNHRRISITDESFLQIYKDCHGNKSDLAKRLGVDRTTVWRRIKKLGLDIDDTQSS